MHECNAPRTNYGQNTEEDQHVLIAMSKSQETNVFTENITGMIANAKKII
jgi:hypothetical protein